MAAGFARALLDFAVMRGADRPTLILRSGLSCEDIDQADTRIPFSAYVSLMRSAQVLCSEPALALHFGAAIDISDVSIVGLLGRASDSLESAFGRLNRYARLLTDAGLGAKDAFSLVREPDGLWVYDTRTIVGGFYELLEASFARMICSSARWFPNRKIIRALRVTWPKPTYFEEYERVLQTPVQFGCDRNAMLTDGNWLSSVPAQASSYLVDVLDGRADRLMAELDLTTTARGKLRLMLESRLTGGVIGADALAVALGMSRRTLARRLALEGTTFRQVLDGVRRDAATHCIDHLRLSIDETTHRTGFSDRAAFSRARKRWKEEG